MGHLIYSVGLRAYGQQDPLVEYKREGHRMFRQLLETIDLTIANNILRAELKPQTPRPAPTFQPQFKKQKRKKKIGRNEPCPCGSGRKYKKCCWPKYE